MAKTPAWQRKEGQSPSGGLNAKGRASAKSEGHNLKPPQPEGGARKNSFCARMTGMKEKLTSKETANDPDSRINKSLRKWNCHADGGPVWDKPRPKKLGKPEPLSSKEKKSAKAMAKAAGRPYPNLVDNMRAARAYGGVVDQAMEFVRRHRQEGGELEGDVQFAPSEEDKLRQIAKEPSYADYFSAPLKYGVETMVSPDIAPQRAMKALVEAPETAKQFAQGAAQSAYSGATLPGDVAMGKVDPMSDEGFKRAQELAGLAQTGSFGFTRPAGSLASGASRPTGEFAAAERAMEAVPTQTAYQRMLTDIGHYSPAAEAASTLKQEKGPASQMLASLRNLPGVKPEELKWSGVESAFQPNETVTRQQIMDYMHENLPKIEETAYQQSAPKEGWERAIERAEARNDWDEVERLQNAWRGAGTTKYSQYTLPGGQNYREVVMHLTAPNVSEAEARKILNAKPDAKLSQADINYASRKVAQEYKSSHWDEPNVLGHLRMSDRTGPEGEKILHIEELQSDWGQEGRKKGFKDTSGKLNYNDAVQALENKRAELNKQSPPIEDINEIHRQLEPFQDAVRAASLNDTALPAAPYVTNTQHWTDLGLKRALREAAEGGYDKMIWTPGEEQAARYDLSKSVGRIAYNPETKKLDTYDLNLKPMGSHSVEPDKLADFIGKEAADKIMSSKPNNLGVRQLQGEGLKVGGEGMKSFYDKVVPTQLSKLLKKLDPKAKIEMGSHSLPVRKKDWDSKAAYKKLTEEAGGESAWNALPKAERDKRLDAARNVQAHVLHITPELRKRILEGLPAYAEGGAVKSAMEFVRKNKSYA